MKVTPYIALVALVLIAIAAPIEAAKLKPKADKGSTTFAISPPALQLSGAAGEQITATVKIENPTGGTGTYKLAPVGLVVSNNDLLEKPLSSLPPDNLARNITFPSAVVTIPSNSIKPVSFTIRIPPNLSGTQYTGITVTNASPNDLPLDRSTDYKRNVGVGMLPAIGINISVNVTGTVKYGLSVNSIKSSPGTASRPPSVTASVTNTSNGELHINPILLLTDSSGKTGIRMRSESVAVLYPGSKKEITFQSAGVPVPPGTYKAIVTIPDPKYKLSPIETTLSIR